MNRLTQLLKTAKYGLEARMTLHIVSSVVIVSLIMTAVAASMFHMEYEKRLNHELDDTIDETQRIIDEQLLQIEVSANTAAELFDYEGNEKIDIDSILFHSLKGNPVQVASTVILDKESNNKEKLYAVVSIDGIIDTLNISQPKLKSSEDDSWNNSFINEKKYWSLPYEYNFKGGKKLDLVTYSLPIYNKKGEKCGIYCSSITLGWLTKTVINSKLSDDIDVAIKADNGKYLVEPGPIVKSNRQEDLIVKEHSIDRLGWNFIISTPRSTITHCVWSAVWKIVAFATLLILVLCISVIYNVRHIARPYVRENALIAQGKAAVDKELSIAANLQRELLPEPAKQNDKVEIKAFLKPAKDIGGDLYDYTVRDNSVFFCIGDVSGKGVPASLFMAMTTVLFRHTINEEHLTQPNIIAKRINDTLSLENKQCMFVTFFVGRLDLTTGELQYCNAGHNSPVLNGKFLPQSDGMPLAIMQESEYENETINLEHGSTLLLYTDGVTEATDTRGSFYGDNKLLELLKQKSHASAKDTLQTVAHSVDQFATGATQHDDITLLSIHFK
ncbi:MAG: SpoIIE family protein phosphatase [Muribaculaceae bacterium]|nr:SpoIIE family protein phosphatase [Muribaculaceae bacterium]